jgi:hypothetical protein
MKPTHETIEKDAFADRSKNGTPKGLEENDEWHPQRSISFIQHSLA